MEAILLTMVAQMLGYSNESLKRQWRYLSNAFLLESIQIDLDLVFLESSSKLIDYMLVNSETGIQTRSSAMFASLAP